MTVAFRSFSKAAAPVWCFSRGTMGSSGSLSCGARISGLHACGEGESVIALESWEGSRALRHFEEGLSRSSRVATGNPGFPRLVPVT